MEAKMMAHGSHDILDGAGLFNSFEDAVSDLDLVICTTSRERSAKHDYHSSRDFLSNIGNKEKEVARIGILFGTEESGIPNELVLKSDMAMSIPMAGPYPSLNLAQSVMIAAYELAPLNKQIKPGKNLSKTGEGWKTLKDQGRKLLIESGIPEGSPLFHRIIERMATIGSNDIPLFLSVISRINKNSN